MKNNGLLFFALVFLMGLFSSCTVNEVDNRIHYVTLGTVLYLDLEGGFYGIIDENNVQLDPVNLPDTFKVDGLSIRLEFVILDDQTSFHQWGTMIEIVSIERLN